MFSINDLSNLDGPDIVYSGNYRIYNCGDQASEIINVLQTLWHVLRSALADANSRISSDAYNAFFKQVYNAPTVAAVISNITTGAAVRGAHFFKNKPAASPIIMCASDPVRDPNNNGQLPSQSSLVRWLARGYNHCKTGVSASQIIGTSIIFLCQPYFIRPIMPLPGQCMLQDSATKEYDEAGGTFAETQVCRVSCGSSMGTLQSPSNADDGSRCRSSSRRYQAALSCC